MNIRNYAWNGSFALTALLVYALLLVPIVVIVLTSFTPRPFPTIPTTGLTIEWYVELFSDQALRSALINSVIVAALSAILSTIIGTISAFGFVRSEFAYKSQVSTFMLLPLMISPVITGLALVRYLSGFSGVIPIVLGHTVLTLPYVFLIVRAELVVFDETLERASRVMGANPIESVVNVTLPNISNAIVSAVLISFVVSFGEFTATQFLTSPSTNTVPVIIYTQLRSGLSPTISALSTVLVLVMLAAAIASGVISRRSS
jgi:ABC-type spermidine/putrescine transport system permease subunit II